MTVFGERDILTENYEKLMPTKVIRLNWEILLSDGHINFYVKAHSLKIKTEVV